MFRIVAMCVFFFGFLHSVQAANQVAIGSCIVQNQNVGSIKNQNVFCENPDEKNSFRIRYIWFNANSASLLFDNIITDELQQLIGTDPLIIENSTKKKIDEIWSIFSTKIANEDGYFYSDAGDVFFETIKHGGGSQDSSQTYFLNESEEGKSHYKLLKDVRFYAANEHVLWPMTLDLQTAHGKQSALSDGLKLTYGIDSFENPISLLKEALSEGKKNFSSMAYQCSLSYGFLKRSEYDSYWNEIENLYKAFTNSEEFKKFATFVEPEFSEEQNLRKTPLAFDALEYFGKNNWPDDFAFKYQVYNFNECGQEPAVRILPRELFIKFAVIQSVNGFYDLKRVSYLEDKSDHLRAGPNFNELNEQEKVVGEIVRKKGQSVLMPIEIQLRYDMTKFPFRFTRPNLVSGRLHKIIEDSGFQSLQLEEGWSGSVISENSISAFKDPEFSKITPSYSFGPAIQLKTVTVGDQKVDVREAPAVASIMNGEFPEGSCPILYFRMQDGSEIKYGRILIGANSEDNSKDQEITIPVNATHAIIREEEPEISFIQKIDVIDYFGDKVTHLENTALAPGQEIEIPLKGTVVSKVNLSHDNNRIKISGFYRTLY